MQSFQQDIRHAARTLRRSPGFTLVASLTVSLGIGGVTAVFSVVDPVLLQPLPFEEQDPVVSLGGRGSSYPEMLDWQAQVDTFEDTGLYWGTSWPLMA